MNPIKHKTSTMAYPLLGFSLALIGALRIQSDATAATNANKKVPTKIQASTTEKPSATSPKSQAEEILANLIDGTSYRPSNSFITPRNPFPLDSVANARLRSAYERMEERRQQQTVSPDLRASSVSKLQSLGPTIAPFLASQLNSPSQVVANVCAEVLGRFGSDSIQPLIAQLKEQGQNQNIQSALRQIGVDAMPPLIDLLQSSKESQRLIAADTINALLPTHPNPVNFNYPQANTILLSNKLIDSICVATTSEKAVKVRLLEVQMLSKLGSRRGVVETFYKLADTDDEPLVRGVAITAVGSIAAAESDQAATPYIAKLIAWAKNDDFDGCRVAAINAIGQAKKASDASVPALIALLDDKRTEIVNAALSSLSKFGDQASPALPALLKIAEQSSDDQQSSLALQTIGHLGANAKPALDILLKNISSSDKKLKRGSLNALQTLARSGDVDLTSSIPKLLEVMNTDEFSTRWEVLRVLEAMGSQAAPAKESLTVMMEKYPRDKSQIQMTLRKISGQAP